MVHFPPLDDLVLFCFVLFSCVAVILSSTLDIFSGFYDGADLLRMTMPKMGGGVSFFYFTNKTYTYEYFLTRNDD